MNPEIQLLADLDAALAHVFSQVEQRPYGLLSYNTANPAHHSANVARTTRRIAGWKRTPEGGVDPPTP